MEFCYDLRNREVQQTNQIFDCRLQQSKYNLSREMGKHQFLASIKLFSRTTCNASLYTLNLYKSYFLSKACENCAKIVWLIDNVGLILCFKIGESMLIQRPYHIIKSLLSDIVVLGKLFPTSKDFRFSKKKKKINK
jgi:hypothetical protein